MDYDFLYNLKLKDTNFQSKLGFNFYSRHKNIYLAEFSQSLSTPNKIRKSVLKTSSAKNNTLDKSTISRASFNHYQNLECFKQKLASFNSLEDSKHSKKPSQDVSFSALDPGLQSLIPAKVLSRAKEIVKKRGVANVTKFYKRQLREFCLEFLSRYKNN